MFDEDLQPYVGTIAAQYFSYDLYDKNAHKDNGAFGSTFMVAGTAQRYSALGGSLMPASICSVPSWRRS